MKIKDKTKVSELQCCPPLEACENCDSIDIKYRLPFRPNVHGVVVPVEVMLHFRFERCSGELALGDLVYSTTLLPGEKVRLFTSDRNTRWSFDSETNLAYRHETTSQESYLMAGVASAMSDLTIVESGSASSSFSESAVSGGGGFGIDLGVVEIGGGVSASSYSATSMSAFARNFSRHAESSSRHVEVGIRAASSTSVGEVERRTHAEGESESHFEASSRLFSNPNRCHSLSFLFYKLNKCQTLCFELIAIERYVDDPAAPTGPVPKPVNTDAKLTVLPRAVLATNANRLELERSDRKSAEETQENRATFLGKNLFQGRLFAARSTAVPPPIDPELQKAALAAVDEELVSERLLDAETGEVSKDARLLFSWKRKTSLPTAGIIVKGCLDECNVCEPALEEEIRLELDLKRFENEKLLKQIELLEKSQEYRCCPAGEVEDETPPL